MLHFFILKEPSGKHHLSAATESSPCCVLALESELLIDLQGHWKSRLKRPTKCQSILSCHFLSLTTDNDGIIGYYVSTLEYCKFS